MKQTVLAIALLITLSSCRKERYLISVTANVTFTASERGYDYFGQLVQKPVELDRVVLSGPEKYVLNRSQLNQWNYVKPGEYTISAYRRYDGAVSVVRINLVKSEYRTVVFDKW